MRWPLSIVALALAAWPAWTVLEGERAQRAWVATQRWQPIAERRTWLDALDACAVIGPEWRLPRRFELALYIASAPQEISEWKGSAWTLTESDGGAGAVVVNLAPRRSGYWRSNEMPWRDRSLCEERAQRPHREANDWFTRLRPRLCDPPRDYESLHVATLQPIARIGGSVVGGPETRFIARETDAAAICIGPAQPGMPDVRRRRFPREREFRDSRAFLTTMRTLCQPGAAGVDPAACAAFASRTPEAAIAR